MLARINKRSILELLETTLVWKHGNFAGGKKNSSQTDKTISRQEYDSEV
jgi:hypothetical protein